jgi:hypothetical protein
MLGLDVATAFCAFARFAFGVTKFASAASSDCGICNPRVQLQIHTQAVSNRDTAQASYGETV